MGHTVVIAEKPSVGRDIARVLKCKEKGEGCLIGDQYIVSWAIGHLVALCDPDELNEQYKKWRMDDLPILPESIPLKVLPKTRSQFSILKKLLNAKETDRVICATDAGREGELIFRFIYQQAGCKKPVDRLWISSMTDEAIREGFAALKPGAAYDNLYTSASCRAQADWLVGMNASRAFTLKHNALLSVGRVQTPTLAILVKRQLEIAAFKPEEYYTVTAVFGDYQGMWFKEGKEGKESDTRLPTKEAAEAVVQAVKGREGQVILSESTPKQEPPPQLYDLTTLQRDANRLLGYTAQKTLKLAQSLYETYKAITYPRTDSRHLPDDMAGPAKQAMLHLPELYQPLIPGAMPEGKLSHPRRVFDNSKVSDHHAILPTTKKADLAKLPPEEKKVFDLIARRLLAAFYPFHTYDALKVVTKVNDHTFRTTGRSIKELGWKKVYEGVEKSKEEDSPIPALSPGDTRAVQKVSSKKETTKPPSPHTDGTLLSAMEHAGRDIEDEELREQMKGSGLGTPATRAAIIERLVEVGYAQRKGRTITAAEKGIELIRVAPQEISSPETTGRWELALDRIASGGQQAPEFLQGIRRLCDFLVRYAKEDSAAGNFPREERGKGKTAKPKAAVQPLPDVHCPLCKEGDVAENSKAFYCTRYRDGCRFTLWKDGLKRGGGPLLTEKLVTLLLKDGRIVGSTGTLTLQEGFLCFTPKAASAPGLRIPIAYNKAKEK